MHGRHPFPQKYVGSQGNITPTTYNLARVYRIDFQMKLWFIRNNNLTPLIGFKVTLGWLQGQMPD